MNADTAARLKIRTLADLVAYAKANPAKLNYGSGGNGSAGHLAGEMFKRDAGIFACTSPTPAATAGAAGAAVGPGRFQLRQPGHRRAQHQERQAQGAGRDHGQAQPRCPKCHRWPTRGQGLRDRHLVRPIRPRPACRRRRDRPLNKAFVAALNSPEMKTRYAA
jgi:hypothetical protein